MNVLPGALVRALIHKHLAHLPSRGRTGLQSLVLLSVLFGVFLLLLTQVGDFPLLWTSQIVLSKLYVSFSLCFVSAVQDSVLQ